MPLGQQVDAVAAIGLLYDQDTLVPTDSAFLVGNGPGTVDVWVQHWRHLDAPVLDTATVDGSTVTLTWSNNHQNRSIDSTVVYRDGSVLAVRDHAATSYQDQNVPNGTHTYTLKHVSTPTTGGEGTVKTPNSAASNARSVVVAVNPVVTIGGPTYINTPGNYTWTASVTGGTAPYTYQWWYRKLSGGAWQQLAGETSPAYTRYVGYTQSAFRLRADVTDAQQLPGSGSIIVDVPWGERPMAAGGGGS